MSPLLQSILAISAAISTVNAMPLGGCGERDAARTMPLSDVDNTGASPLPTPSTDPKYIALGIGFQNYTCNATAATPAGAWIQTTISAGAVAELYDISQEITPQTHDQFTRQALNLFQICIEQTHCNPSAANNFCGVCHDVAANRFRTHVDGVHFFDQLNGVQTPNFNLFAGGDFLSAKKTAAVKAPASADHGANRLGAVDWIYLVDNKLGRSHGLSSVYRIETAGGVAPKTCNQVGGQLHVPYAAEYWFYA